jgi:segregation and condensation protein B
MGTSDDVSTVEAALYASDRPLSLDELKETVGTSSETYIRKLLDKLRDRYDQDGSLELKETTEDMFTVQLREEFMPKVEGVVPKTKLSKGALKTLAVIAYKQPIKQSELAEIRGGRVYKYVRRLQELDFVEAEPLGRTKVLRTSKKFAGYFGMEDQMDKIREKLQQMVR